jgi:hypothetical protein
MLNAIMPSVNMLSVTFLIVMSVIRQSAVMLVVVTMRFENMS